MNRVSINRDDVSSGTSVDDLFTVLQPRLRRTVRHAVRTSDATVDDACAFAWLQFVRYQPTAGVTLFAWLRTTAIREAIDQDRRERAVSPLDGPALDHFSDPRYDADRQLDAASALGRVAALPARQARMVALHAMGYSYNEIASITRDSRRTVERQLLRGKRSLAAATDGAAHA